MLTSGCPFWEWEIPAIGFLTGGDRRARYETVGVNRVRPLKSEHLRFH